MSDQILSPWYKMPWVILTDNRHQTRVWVSLTLLCSNPQWLFSKMFSGRYEEPAHIYVNTPEKERRKLYPLDVCAQVLTVIVDVLLWQCPDTFISPAEAKSIYTEQKLGEVVSLDAWFRILEYYGFAAPQIRNASRVADMNPHEAFYYEFASVLAQHVLPKHPDWNKFTCGSTDTLHYQFAYKNGPALTTNAEYIHKLTIADVPVDTAAYLKQCDNSTKDATAQAMYNRILLDAFQAVLPCLKGVSAYVLVGKDAKVIKHWPLTYPLGSFKEGDVSRQIPTKAPEQLNTTLPDNHSLVTLMLTWRPRV